MLRLLSLFDYSGNWSKPFSEGGWDVVQWDIKLSELMDINLLDSAETVLEQFESVDGILAAVPCTDFTNSGAQYWTQKDEDGRTQFSIELVRQVQRIADFFRPTDPEYDLPFFWVIENPVGRLSRLFPELDKPVYFHPYEFAGYNIISDEEIQELNRIRLKDGKDVTNSELDLVLRTNAYSKKTGLWGEFNKAFTKKIVPPVKCSRQGTYTQRYGGKSDRTKELRSNTPLGFAQAFFEANKDYQCYLTASGDFIYN